MRLRDETGEDVDTVRRIVAAAFAGHPHSDGREPAIVDARRASHALSVALVAELDGRPAGHIAFSRVLIDGRWHGWYGLGPVAVDPPHQGKGMGQALVREGLARLRGLDAVGCVVFGSPAYYGRFGFAAHPDLRFEGGPAAYFMALPLVGPAPVGVVTYDPAFADA